MAAGRVAKPGAAAFERRVPERTGVYSFERRTPLTPACLDLFRADRPAWSYYQAQAPWYRRTTAHWVMSAKRDATRERRLAALIDSSRRGEPIKALDRRRSS
jgi:hypothetical protein